MILLVISIISIKNIFYSFQIINTSFISDYEFVFSLSEIFRICYLYVSLIEYITFSF